MTKWTFAPHRPYLLVSPVSFLYIHIDFLLAYVYIDTHMSKFIFSPTHLSQVCLYNLYENDC